MNFFIANSFMKSLERLSPEDRERAKLTAFDFQANPANPGGSFHKLDRAKDANFWSFRVSRDLRIIVHRDGAHNVMLCYAGHHDDAYQWAERKTLEVHPETGAAQFVEVKERIEEVVRQVVRTEEPPIFQKYGKEYLLGLGVPAEWVDPLRTMGEAAFLDIADQLPEEAAERLLELAAGKTVPLPPASKAADPLTHPDAQRRFQRLETQSELQAALDAPWERWTVFLHPDQRALVNVKARGPIRVTGGAGTGKSVVALHRAASLARASSESKVLLTTFSKALAARLEHSLNVLMGQDAARQRITVRHLHSVANHLVSDGQMPIDFVPISSEALTACVATALHGRANEWLTAAFIRSEWDKVVDAHGITSFSDYQAVCRKGRSVPLSAKKRQLVWTVMQSIHQELARQGLSTYGLLCAKAVSKLEATDTASYGHVIVDECQDFGPAELALLRALVKPAADDLFFCGDEGQRIYQPRVSWLSLGIDVRGRSHRLKLNYRTTEQIRRNADALLPAEVLDGEGEREAHDTVSLLSGPVPQLSGFDSQEAEQAALVAWLENRRDEGLALHEIAVFARTGRLLEERVRPALRLAKLDGQSLKSDAIPVPERVATGTLHAAKGLEFRAVAVVGCDRAQLPLRAALTKLQDPADRETFIENERNLLYVACTRARERLLVTWTGEPCDWLSAKVGARARSKAPERG